MLKVKAHLKYRDVVEQRIPWHAWLGNGVADMWAKRGGVEAERLSPSAWIHSRWTRACRYYRWAAKVAAEWAIDTETSAVPIEQAATPHAAASRNPIFGASRNRGSHELWRTDHTVQCRLCGIVAPRVDGKCPAAFNRPCADTMGRRCGVAGRERAVAPRPSSTNDGAVSAEVLHRQGAQRVFPCSDGSRELGPLRAAGGHAAGHLVGGTPLQAQPNHTPPEQFESMEEDPFGFQGPGFDDGQPAAPAPASQMPMDPGQNKVAHPSHSLRRCAYVEWCLHCGRHAAKRLGIGLLNSCRGIATGGYPSRISRLLDGRHPMTGARLV